MGSDSPCPFAPTMPSGPQADPDYFTPEDMQTLYSTAYKIHHNS